MSTPGEMKRGDAAPLLSQQRLWEGRLGWLVGVDLAGRPLVDYEGNERGPLVARSTVELLPERLQQAVEARHPVELRFENGEGNLPIILEVYSEPAALLEEALNTPPAASEEVEEQDGVKVYRGRKGLLFKCGKASLLLRHNGKVVLSGTYVEIRSTGVQRFNGGVIEFN